VARRFGGVAAASLAVSRSVLALFPPLLPTLILEDCVLYLRSVLLGTPVHIPEPLVRYRLHRDNISQAYALDDFGQWRARYRERLQWQSREAAKAYAQMLVDLHSQPALGWPPRDMARARRAALERLLCIDVDRSFYASDDAVGLLDGWRSLVRVAAQLLRFGSRRVVPWLGARADTWHYEQLRKTSQRH
jgi:hypothetical protein